MADTRMQIRTTTERKERWTEAAGGKGKLSQWVEETLDRAANGESQVGVNPFLPDQPRFAEMRKFALELDPDIGPMFGRDVVRLIDEITGLSTSEEGAAETPKTPDEATTPSDASSSDADDSQDGEGEKTEEGGTTSEQDPPEEGSPQDVRAEVDEIASEVVDEIIRTPNDALEALVRIDVERSQQLRKVVATAKSGAHWLEAYFPGETAESLEKMHAHEMEVDPDTEPNFADWLVEKLKREGWLDVDRDLSEETSATLQDGQSHPDLPGLVYSTVEGRYVTPEIHQALTAQDAAFDSEALGGDPPFPTTDRGEPNIVLPVPDPEADRFADETIFGPPKHLVVTDPKYNADAQILPNYYAGAFDGDDTAPEPEDPKEFPPPTMLEPVGAEAIAQAALTQPSLRPDCTNAAMHWRMTRGEQCRSCKGIA